MKVVIDHLSGSRRGQRQELAGDAKVRFGRHPECEVSFDAHRDIDASSRHAELRPPAPSAGGPDAWVLVDVGSSNGTYVDGRRVTEAPLAAGTPVMVEFGPSGPRLRLFIGDEEQVIGLGAPLVERPPPRRNLPLLVAAVVVTVAAAVVALVLALG